MSRRRGATLTKALLTVGCLLAAPLAQAISLAYSSPIFVTIAAVFLLGEKVRLRRWLAVLAGFIGMLVIVRPGTAEFTVDAMIAVLAAVMSALVAIQIKQLSQTEPADRIVIYTTLLWVPMSLLPALAVWEWPQGITWVWVVAAGVLAYVLYRKRRQQQAQEPIEGESTRMPRSNGNASARARAGRTRRPSSTSAST